MITSDLGATRIKRFKEAFDKNVQSTLDLDYMGEHYVRLEDYAVELNEKFNMGINVERVAACQNSYDEEDEKYLTCKVDRVIQELMGGGYSEAADFLRAKLW